MPAEGPQPAVVIYSLADALAAASASQTLNLPVILRVPDEVAAGLGADVIASLFALARDRFPRATLTSAVDCGDAPGLAIALLRRGIDRVRVDGPEGLLRRVADIARECGAALDGDETPPLDLLSVDDAGATCMARLGGFKTGSGKPNCE